MEGSRVSVSTLVAPAGKSDLGRFYCSSQCIEEIWQVGYSPASTFAGMSAIMPKIFDVVVKARTLSPTEESRGAWSHCIGTSFRIILVEVTTSMTRVSLVVLDLESIRLVQVGGICGYVDAQIRNPGGSTGTCIVKSSDRCFR